MRWPFLGRVFLSLVNCHSSLLSPPDSLFCQALRSYLDLREQGAETKMGFSVPPQREQSLGRASSSTILRRLVLLL